MANLHSYPLAIPRETERRTVRHDHPKKELQLRPAVDSGLRLRSWNGFSISKRKGQGTIPKNRREQRVSNTAGVRIATRVPWSPKCRRPVSIAHSAARDHTLTSAYHVAVRAQRRLAWVPIAAGPL